MHKRRKFTLIAAVLAFCSGCILILTRTQEDVNSKISLETGNWGGSGLEQQLRSMRAQLQTSASILQAHSAPSSNEWEQSAAEEWHHGMRLIHDAPMLASRTSFPSPTTSRSSFLVGDADPDSPSFRPPPTPPINSPALESAIMDAPSPLGVSLPQLLSTNPRLSALPQPAQAAAPPPAPPPAPARRRRRARPWRQTRTPRAAPAPGPPPPAPPRPAGSTGTWSSPPPAPGPARPGRTRSVRPARPGCGRPWRRGRGGR
mmetsp:Transcript_44781/g.93798  ORF Transcript_44781/g.93798 Transcript_44781/m.93798 type:complete len:259 (-) Transcript_44781:90-866(-)